MKRTGIIIAVLAIGLLILVISLADSCQSSSNDGPTDPEATEEYFEEQDREAQSGAYDDAQDGVNAADDTSQAVPSEGL